MCSVHMQLGIPGGLECKLLELMVDTVGKRDNGRNSGGFECTFPRKLDDFVSTLSVSNAHCVDSQAKKLTWDHN